MRRSLRASSTSGTGRASGAGCTQLRPTLLIAGRQARTSQADVARLRVAVGDAVRASQIAPNLRTASRGSRGLITIGALPKRAGHIIWRDFRARSRVVNHRVCRRFRIMKHGHTRGRTTTPEYQAWRSMISRCTLPSASHYAEYGGRGIAVCDEWRRSFLAFYGHVGPRPSPTHSLDRIDTDGHYEPGNVRWATRAQQHRNRRCSRLLTIDGERMCLSDWVARSPVSFSAIVGRLDRGWDHASAVFAPSQNVGPRSMRIPHSYRPWVCVQCNVLVLGRKKANAGRCDACKTAA